MSKLHGSRGREEAQAAVRRCLVRYLELQQGTQQQAAEIFGLSVAGVKSIWKRYKEGGAEAIAFHPRGRESGNGALSGVQVKSICKEIAQGVPKDAAYPLWNAMAVRELVKKRRV